MVLLPGMLGKRPADWGQEFGAIEHRFAPQALIAALLVLLSGLYMLYYYDLWDRFAQGKYWWMDLMVGAWMLFAALLFVIEPSVFRHLVHRGTARAPEATLTVILWLHHVMLMLSPLAVFAAVRGSHGGSSERR